MTVTASSFRVSYAAFADTTKYSDAYLNLWIGRAPTLLDPTTWGSDPALQDIVTELLVAHVVTLGARNAAAAAAGGTPGMTSGPISSKSVGGASISYDVAAGTVPDAGWFNLTEYGVQLVGMMELMGAGGLQLGGGWYNPALWDNSPSLIVFG